MLMTRRKRGPRGAQKVHGTGKDGANKVTEEKGITLK